MRQAFPGLHLVRPADGLRGPHHQPMQNAATHTAAHDSIAVENYQLAQLITIFPVAPGIETPSR